MDTPSKIVGLRGPTGTFSLANIVPAIGALTVEVVQLGRRAGFRNGKVVKLIWQRFLVVACRCH